MNYEAGMLGRDEQLALTDERAGSSRRKWIIIAIAIVVLAAIAWYALGSGKKDAKPAAAAGKSAQQLPRVTVAVPGRQSIERVVIGTGSLAARREMPVGVAGEGGMVN